MAVSTDWRWKFGEVEGRQLRDHQPTENAGLAAKLEDCTPQDAKPMSRAIGELEP
jgi:hypothetical protein